MHKHTFKLMNLDLCHFTFNSIYCESFLCLVHCIIWFQVKDINARLEGIQPKVRSSDGIPGGYITGEIKHVSVNPKKSSPKAKSSSRENSLFGG